MTTDITAQDEAIQALAASALALAEETPAMIDGHLATVYDVLEALYVQIAPDGHAALDAAFEVLLNEIEQIRALSNSQAIGVASVGIVATAHKIQRDEAVMEVRRLTKALKKMGILRGNE